MKLPKPNIGPWIIRISKHIHIQIFSDVELQSLRTGAPKIRSDYGIFLIIIVCKSDTPIFGSDYDPRVFHFPDRVSIVCVQYLNCCREDKKRLCPHGWP